MDAKSTHAPAPTPRRGRRPRRILAIGLVGTGLYAGMFGSGAAAEPVAPAIAPDPSPEPPSPIEAPAVVPAVVTASSEPPPPIEAPAIAPAASPEPPPADAPAAASAVSPAPVDAGPAPAPPTVSAGPPAEAPEVRRRDRRRATREPQRKPNASVGSGRLEHPPTSAVRAEPQPSRDAPPPGVAAFPLAGPATAIAVPDFFVGRFRIPPVLLPIYQAAAVRYGVRWQILAAINEIETDYGRNLSVSRAGALGWMQFVPATWKAYGIDANRDGLKDPYNPSDAVFAAARYLRAAGAAHDLRRAIYAYNHADWYVDSVLMRARLIAALPYGALASLTWLGRGRSPVPRASLTTTDGVGGHRVRIIARGGARVVAVNDGTIVRVGHSARLGRFVKLRDYSGNTYTYGRLNAVASNERSRARRGARIAAGAILGRVGRETGGRTGASCSRSGRRAARRRGSTRGRSSPGGGSVSLRRSGTSHAAPRRCRPAGSSR